MTQKEECRPSVSGTQDGRGKRTGKTSTVIVRRSGYPVNGIFSCSFVREVFDLLAQPRTIDEIARITESTTDRVRLALHELKASGVIIS